MSIKEQKPDIIITLTELIRDSGWGKGQGQEELWDYIEKSLKRDEQVEQIIKEIEELQLVGRQSNPSDERGAGYKLGSLNICDIALNALKEVRNELL